jgi:hypothetical protein
MHTAADLFARSYDADFAEIQTPERVSRLSNADLGLLFGATFAAQFYTQGSKYIHDMQLDLTTLERRGHATDAEYQQMYNAFVGNRLFSDAQRLAASHSRVAFPFLPKYVDRTIRDGKPTVMALSSDGSTLVRKTFDLSAPAQVVIIASPLCHFAQYSLKDIQGDSALRTLFSKHATWLVPPDDNSTPFTAIRQWNQSHPGEQMKIAYAMNEWPMFDRWQLPTFYFLKRDHVVSEVVGWPRTGRRMEVLAALRKIGLN